MVTDRITSIEKYLKLKSKTATLAVFRFLFGLMMFLSIIRFWSKGWIETIYLEPNFHFSYYGFEWAKPLGDFTYVLFLICGLASLFIAIGYKYRISVIIFFLSFSYIELMDKTTYLNHYYFISILSFLLIFLPANATFSIDSYLRKREYSSIPKWTIDSIKLLLAIVYFHAGIAKLNSDWLFRAQPLRIWLPSKYDFPLIGENLLQQEWFHYAMSWGGAAYDLSIPFLLYYKKTRKLGFILVLVFHLSTSFLFPSIGMFPFIMIVATLVFLDENIHERLLNKVKSKIKIIKNIKTLDFYNFRKIPKRIIVAIFSVFFLFQFLLPWRYLLYPDELFWTEEGYKFSWRVLLTEKTGLATFKIVDGKTKEFFYVNNTDFLSRFQEKQMSCQPSAILEYAHYLGNHFKSQGHKNVEVYVDSFVALNGRMSSRFIDPKINLYKVKESFSHKDWIIPFSSEIKIKGI